MATFEEKLIAMLNPVRFRPTTSSQQFFGYKHPFESDYFRIVTSAPVRRLQDKTQIFPQEKSDFVRRRLTHSIEVGAIGRRLGWMVEDELKDKNLVSEFYFSHYEHSLASILETAGLVHDIGNPPFGHFGETTIQSFFANIAKNCNNSTVEAFNGMEDAHKQDFLHFDGNVQGLRILRYLGLSTDNNSFNLTMPTLAAIIKYPYSSTDGNKSKKEAQNHAQQKFGYFQSEVSAYEQIYNTLSMKPNQRHPLAYLLEAADDIANVTSDVEDGYKMGIISLEEIKRMIDTADWTKDLSQSINFENIETCLNNQRNQCVNKDLMPPEITNELRMKEFRIRCVSNLLVIARDIFMQHIEEILDAAYKETDIPDTNIIGNELLKECPLFTALSELQKKTYADKEVLKSELLGENVITELLWMFTECMFSSDIKSNENTGKLELNTKTSAGKLYALISDNYKRAAGCKTNEVPEEPYRRFLLAVDHVAGMTDSYAVDLYNELTNRKG